VPVSSQTLLALAVAPSVRGPYGPECQLLSKIYASASDEIIRLEPDAGVLRRGRAALFAALLRPAFMDPEKPARQLLAQLPTPVAPLGLDAL